MIEAKSAGLYAKAQEVCSQLAAYLDPNNFPHDAGVPVYGVTLTKYKLIYDTGYQFLSLQWTDIVELINEMIRSEKKSGEDTIIAKRYIDFIHGVAKGMKYYEVEVLSVSAGKTHELTYKHCIHACPNSAKGYIYKTPLFITFVPAGAEKCIACTKLMISWFLIHSLHRWMRFLRGFSMSWLPESRLT